eukprot:PhM_4_TR3971/c0_g1_i1/m.60165
MLRLTSSRLSIPPLMAAGMRKPLQVIRDTMRVSDRTGYRHQETKPGVRRLMDDYHRGETPYETYKKKTRNIVQQSGISKRVAERKEAMNVNAAASTTQKNKK